jgi:single-strand DNA-binding protein
MVNRVTLIGNVGKEPEVRYTQKGDAILSFSLATTERDKDKNEVTQWHRVTIFGKLADALKDYITKGQQLYVEGQLQYSDWTDKNGNEHKHDAKIIVGFNGVVKMLGRKGDGGAKKTTTVETSSGPVEVGGGSDDEIPF